MEVLFEYRGSRRPLTIASGDSVTQCVSNELHLLGRSGARVVTADIDLNTATERDQGGRVYLLQRWSPQWGCYIDVSNIQEIQDGDKLAVISKPKPPSKFLLLCCGCCSSSSAETTSNVKGVPKKTQKRVRKNEEIQSLDYKFTVVSEANSECGDSQSTSASDTQQQDGVDDKHYVRGPTGRASWKLIPINNEATAVHEVEDHSTSQREEMVQDENTIPDVPNDNHSSNHSASVDSPSEDGVQDVDDVPVDNITSDSPKEVDKHSMKDAGSDFESEAIEMGVVPTDPPNEMKQHTSTVETSDIDQPTITSPSSDGVNNTEQNHGES